MVPHRATPEGTMGAVSAPRAVVVMAAVVSVLTLLAPTRVMASSRAAASPTISAEQERGATILWLGCSPQDDPVITYTVDAAPGQVWDVHGQFGTGPGSGSYHLPMGCVGPQYPGSRVAGSTQQLVLLHAIPGGQVIASATIRLQLVRPIAASQLTASPRIVKYGQTFRLSGHYVYSPVLGVNRPVVGTVRVYFLPGGRGQWHYVLSMPTTSTGGFDMVGRATATGNWDVSYPGSTFVGPGHTLAGVLVTR